MKLNQLTKTSLSVVVLFCIAVGFAGCRRCDRIDHEPSAYWYGFYFRLVKPHVPPAAQQHDLVPDSLDIGSIFVTNSNGHTLDLSFELDSKNIHEFGKVIVLDQYDAIETTVSKTFYLHSSDLPPDTLTIELTTEKDRCDNVIVTDHELRLNENVLGPDGDGQLSEYRLSGSSFNITIVKH